MIFAIENFFMRIIKSFIKNMYYAKSWSFRRPFQRKIALGAVFHSVQTL